MFKTLTSWLIVTVALLAWSGATYAQPEPCESFYSETIKSQALDGAWAFSEIYGQAANTKGCILGIKDTTAIAPIIKSLLADNGLDRLSIRVKQQQVIDRVLADLRSLASGPCSGDNPSGCLIERQTDKVTALGILLGGSITNTNPLFRQNNWVVKSDGRQLVSGDNLNAYVVDQCTNGLATANCQTGILHAAKIIRSGESMAQLVTSFQAPIIGQNKQFLTSRERQWDQYFNAVSVQYPWELALNSWWYTRNKSSEVLAKFPEAPTSKFIALHPSVGYERINTPLEGGRVAASVLIEIVGYERWRWKNGQAENRWGGAVVAAYADIYGMDSVGYGLVLHTPIRNTSIGVIWRDGDQGVETGLFINIDLAKFIMQYDNKNLTRFLAR